jgi:hypothetical protein
MKDTASRISDNSGLPSGGAKAIARRIRSAIRRAVKAERERCLYIVSRERKRVADGLEDHRYLSGNIIQAINTPAKKRPSKRKGRR